MGLDFMILSEVLASGKKKPQKKILFVRIRFRMDDVAFSRWFLLDYEIFTNIIAFNPL